ncbi:MAG: glycosyltransferase family 4 protein [Brachybacterium sp.]|nr:glycosyltransferase family 4 protein [Brachybacterium sp.]
MTTGPDGAPRTVLWLVPVADLGGVARHVLDATRVGIPGWRIVVLCPPGPLAEQLRDQGTPVITGPVSPVDGALTAMRTVHRVLRRLRPDLLHTHLAFADVTGAAAVLAARSGRGRRVRVVSTEHGIAAGGRLYQRSAIAARGKALMHRARLHRTDRVIAVSESTRREVLAQWGRRAPVTVIRNGVDLPAKPVAPDRGLRFLSLARLAPEKRIDRVLDAFAVVVAEYPQARLTIAGTGELQQSICEHAARLGLSGQVDFIGHADPAAALRDHDVVVQLSAWENLSYTLLDAVVHGRGVVASDVGGNAEIVPHRCLVDAEDPLAVAGVMVVQATQLASRPTPRDLGESGQHGVRAMVTAIAGVYAEVIG